MHAMIHPAVRWTAFAVEVIAAVLCCLYLITTNTVLLILWEILVLLYIAAGLKVVWRGQPLPEVNPVEVKSIYRWTWVSNALAAAVGIYSAVVALSAQGQHNEQANLLATLAGGGIALAWVMLHVGFAEIYQILDAKKEQPGIDFPDQTRSMLNYIYFSFTVAVSFATSDPTVQSVQVRRVVLIQSIFSFFYNAVVVAVAIQIMQSFIAGQGPRKPVNPKKVFSL